MCGLAGILGPWNEERSALLAAMGESLRHRGPDDEGLWNPQGPLGLVHRRLAIVDLSAAGAQPMVSKDGRWILVFNGEIYNHRAIRLTLEGDGIGGWRGHSDTEVLLEAIAHWGFEAALQRCNGMFALAAWDVRRQELWLARDRTGEKPLYVGWLGGDLVFASELKALRRHPAWQHAVDPGAMSLMLSLGYVPAPLSIHPGVFKLPAASLVRFVLRDAASPPDAGDFAAMIKRYWRLEEIVDASLDDLWRESEVAALEAIQNLLDEAVAMRMVADVPVGALLSGGIDSSLVVASMARQASSSVRTFTVCFEEAGINEAEHASETALYLGTRHEVLPLPSGSALELVERLPEVYDEPFADAAQLPALLVADAARGQVTVVLTGDGGDELFHGYQRYLDGERLWARIGHWPEALRRGMAGSARGLAGITGTGAIAERLRRQAGRLGGGDFDDYYRRLLGFPGALPGAPPNRVPGFTWPRSPPRLREFGARMRFVDQALSLPEGIHVKLDRASMAAGLELRVPLLDHRLLELAWRLPPAWHAKGGVGKRMLRKLAERQLPQGLASRRKQGFDVPISSWLRGPLRTWAQDLLSPSAIAADPMLDAAAVERCLSEHLSRHADHGYALWALLMYRTWSLRYG